jgi:hypothetical protein
LNAKTGVVCSLFNEQCIPCSGIESSREMVEYAKYKNGDENGGREHNELDIAVIRQEEYGNTMLYDSGSFTHIVCLGIDGFYGMGGIRGMGIDQERQKKIVMNVHKWLKHGGYFVIQLVDKKKYNMFSHLYHKSSSDVDSFDDSDADYDSIVNLPKKVYLHKENREIGSGHGVGDHDGNVLFRWIGGTIDNIKNWWSGRNDEHSGNTSMDGRGMGCEGENGNSCPIKKVVIDYGDFEYKCEWCDNDAASLKMMKMETFTDKKSGNVRKNELEFTIPHIKNVVSLIESCGFSEKGKINVGKSSNEGKRGCIYIFQKMDVVDFI